MKHYRTTAPWAALLTLAAILTSPPSHAVQVDPWPFDRLRSESDLVVVVTPVTTKVTGERVHGPLWQVDFVGVNTTVKVVGVIKGRYSQPELTVFHLQFPDGTRINQGPFLGELKSQPISHPQPDGTRRSGPPEYMVFLKKRDDGRYEPTSGPLDSAYAFRELRIPAVGR